MRFAAADMPSFETMRAKVIGMTERRRESGTVGALPPEKLLSSATATTVGEADNSASDNADLSGRGVTSCPSWLIIKNVEVELSIAASLLNNAAQVADPDRVLAFTQNSIAEAVGGLHGDELRRISEPNIKLCMPHVAQSMEKLRAFIYRRKNDAKPEVRLAQAYENYIAIRSCFKSRQGYSQVYITPQELEEARAQVKSVESAIILENHNIDKGKVWDAANLGVADQSGENFDPGKDSLAKHALDQSGMDYCKSTQRRLLEITNILVPRGPMKKDF